MLGVHLRQTGMVWLHVTKKKNTENGRLNTNGGQSGGDKQEGLSSNDTTDFISHVRILEGVKDEERQISTMQDRQTDRQQFEVSPGFLSIIVTVVIGDAHHWRRSM